MPLLTGDGFDKLFRAFEKTAFHLELKDSYYVPEESGPFTLFLEGEPDDFAWHQPWLKIVREAAGAGKSMTRVRVVTVPHTDYVRWGLTVAPLNIGAGEDIRWLPRHQAADIDFPADDYWASSMTGGSSSPCSIRTAGSWGAGKPLTPGSSISAAAFTSRHGHWPSLTPSTSPARTSHQ